MDEDFYCLEIVLNILCLVLKNCFILVATLHLSLSLAAWGNAATVACTISRGEAFKTAEKHSLLSEICLRKLTNRAASLAPNGFVNAAAAHDYCMYSYLGSWIMQRTSARQRVLHRERPAHGWCAREPSDGGNRFMWVSFFLSFFFCSECLVPLILWKEEERDDGRGQVPGEYSYRYESRRLSHKSASPQSHKHKQVHKKAAHVSAEAKRSLFVCVCACA